MKRFAALLGCLAVAGCSASETVSTSDDGELSLMAFEPFLGSWQDETEGRRLVLERNGDGDVLICYFERQDEGWSAQLMGSVSERDGQAEGSMAPSAQEADPIELTAYPVEGGELDWDIVFVSPDGDQNMNQTWSAPAGGQFTVVSEVETENGQDAPIVSTLWTTLDSDSFDCRSGVQ